ncbi:erythrocyte membrane protein 1 [Plasmodium falciparum RAJ116]|uniref:Erythrocyte membrane protein 1 n=1 Tax=Plasmodium falciparum RAJ116 TaxID=580058 RepID=A0A0L0CTP9_PLAFA|nr:erythrocyte membrane protein 1 [Plasmodium falciparum RAJ116]
MVQKGGGEDGIDHQSAKHLLDSIGKKVYDKAKKNAEQYFNELHGSLKDAIFEKLPNGQQTPPNPCDLDYQWHTNATNVRSYPCRAGKEERFSQVHGGECDDKKIEGNGRNNGGACAPFRRLHLCVRNLENININKYINKDTLLADVCLAAKYEGDLIKTHYTPYQHKYDDSPSQICTMLARSFADIGDIIRGKDLYLGNKQEKKQRDKLENNLKTIFKKIHEGLKDPKKSHYNDSEGNYFQLREDWWNNNRIMVWYAMTCGEPEKAEYFRKACSGGTTLTNKKCRCTTNDVPTYFDYVPQYLRWFEEWAEDFCRKRKKKIENAIKNCRNDEEERYCSGNGYDCTQTIRGDEHFVEGDCHKCSVSCKPFVKWIDNQKLEFLKQIKKYEKEITKKHDETTTITTTHGTINNMYVDVFYNKLQEHYPSVDAFLELLSKEKICKDPPKIEKQTASSVDFKNHEDNGTFCRTKYCEPCPWCGLEKGGPPWTPKKEKECRSKEIRNFDDRNSTEIELLDKNTSGTNIVDKLGGLCNDSSKPTIQKWKCYYKKEDTNTGIPRSNDCILQDGNEVEPENRTIHSFNSLFWQWVTEMFEDSIKWRKEHENCMKKGDKSTCKKGCKKPCDCFKNWVDQKKKEWKQIEQHYVKEDFEGFGTYGTFEYLLKEDYFPKIKAPYKEVKSVQEFIIEMEQIIDENYANISNCTKDNNSIKELLEYEEEIAKGCQSKRNCPPKPQQPAGGGPGGRSLPPAEHEEDDDHPDDPNNIRSIKFPDEEGKDPVFKDHQDDEGSEDNTVEPEPTSEGPQKEDTPQIDVCKTVAKALTDQTNLTKACGLKYGHPQRHWGWKCIPTSGGDTGSTTSSEGGDRAGPSRKRREAPGEKATGKSGSDKDGATCIPPRRRKLYIHKVENDGINDDASLRDWFVKSAAVETFFLWHRYKKEKKPQAPQDGAGLVLPLLEPSPPGEDPQTQLKSGTIPPDFLRLMFYTLGDYRDLCVGNTNIVVNASGSSEQEKQKMNKIQQEIDKILEKSGEQTPPKPGKTSDKDRPSLWDRIAQPIWNGMICALTYKDSGGKDKTPTQIDGAQNLLDKLKGKYSDYKNVKLENSETEAISNDTIQPPTLKQFTSRPTYFRYLHEWGEEFCRERTKRLKDIKYECRGDRGGHEYCSGDGHDCTDNDRKYNKMFADFHCPGCAKECMKYKTWIYKKFAEFQKQKDKYKGEHKKLTNNSNGDYKKLKGYSTAADFLKELKHCKDGQTGGEQGNQEDKENNKIDFSKPLQTFSRSTYCKACPIYGVTCNSGGRGGRSGHNPCSNNEPENKENTADGQPTTIPILINDGATNDIDQQLQKDCTTYGLYKDLRKQEWKCQKMSDGVQECSLNNADKSAKFVDSTYYDEKIPFNILFHRWLIDFIQYYNKSKKEITRCTNKGENKCDCVQKWLNKKSSEWEIIKKYYKQNFQSDDERIASRINSFFEQGPFYSLVEEAKKVVDEENKRDELWGCTGSNNCSEEEKKKEDDFITNLISKLNDKIQSCQNQHNEQTKAPCDENPPHSDETLEEQTDDDTTDKQSPEFCKDVEDTKEPETDSDRLCDDKNQTKCNDFQKYTNSTCEPKKTLIGLGAHYHWAGSDYPNVYISPRVDQLCLQPLQELKEVNKNTSNVSELIEAFKKCAYNEAKGLYKYYNDNKKTFENNGSTLSEKEITTYILEAMERSYADYGNIVKGDMYWNYENNNTVNEIIFSFADLYNTSNSSNFVRNIHENVKRLNLWKFIRAHVWKAMICGYKNAIGGDMNRLPNGDDLCKLPTTDGEYPFLRWFEEWGQNFCIRHEKELKQLKEKCDNVTCNGTDEEKKKKCEKACKNYREFLNNFKKQYENQKKEYEIIKSSFNEYKNKDAMTFLKEKCNLKCLCFKDKSGTYFDDLLKNLPDDFTYECECKTSKEHDHKVNDLDKCANDINNNNNNICNKYKKRRMCGEFKYSNSLDNWYGRNMLIPPRRRKICLRNIPTNRYKKNNGKNKFKDDLLSAAASEAKFLFKNYEDINEALQAIKYTFADIGDIIKGNDIMDDMAYKKIKVKLENVLEKTGNEPKNASDWWDQNKKHVWEAMLCGYKEAGREIKPDDCNIPTEENTHQFLRWLTEWGTQYCKEKQQLKLNMQIPCKTHFDKYGIIEKRNDVHPNCLPNVEKYEIWINNRLPEWNRLSNKFDELKSTMKEDIKDLTAYQYLKQNCSKCICSFKDIEQTHKKSKDEGYHIYEDILDKAQIPSFLEDIAYRYKGLNPECPEDIECSQYENIPCRGLVHDDDNDWNSSFVKDNKKTNMGVLLPPRRKQVCLRIDAEQIDHLRSEIENFKNFICSSAFAEAKRLKHVYKDDNKKLLQAIKYSFADIGSIVKGEDMKEGTASDNITKIFNGSKYSGTDRKKWWNENKYHVWESMLCGYREAGGDTKTNENCRFPDIERVPQFLRWFQEWTEIFCNKRNKLYKVVQSQCSTAICNKEDGSVAKTECTKACEEYKNYVLKKKKEYYIQKDKYDNQFKKVLNNKDAEEFLNVHCLSEYFKDETRWKNPYDTFDDKNIKDKCDCKKIEHPSSILPDARPLPPLNPEVEPPQADEPFDPTILQTTIPFGVALALGSIAFLFLKKKIKSPVDFFSVLEIPQNDYGMPTLKSSNRYIPYTSGKYRGKRYIYLEGDSGTDSGYTDHYSDITSSSESEYEELDINDIYVPGSPKYKTLIEVVLEPSGNNTTASGKNTPSDTQNDIQNDGIPSSDIPTNKFTDNEWNQLKHDFISQYLQSEQPNDVPNDYTSGNSSTNTNITTTSRDNMEEKPFIMSIHDRNLYSGEEYNYNVNMSTNSMDDIPINRDNNVYSGIDLINDSLNSGNEHIDIYDELLKRKENELFGTNHVKHTSTHSVAKNTNSDPILNQINLFHTWLDRHRDMCEQWNNKEELLDKLKEKWENETHSGNTHPSDSNKTLNTDVSIQIHMDNPKPINQFTNMDTYPENSTMDTILEDLEKYNEPYYDVQDDIYYDVNDHDASTVDSNNMDVPSKVQIEMDINTKLVKEKYPIADVWDI